MDIKAKRIFQELTSALLTLSLMTIPVRAQEAAPFSLAPPNARFVEFLKQKAALTATREEASGQEVTGEEHALGYVPEPVDMSHLKGQQLIRPLIQLGLPVSFDLRTQGKVTPVRNQGSCGSCWVFATMGSAESNLLPGETRDFSENNLKNTAGFLLTPCKGGNAAMSTAYLARWSGPVNEIDDRYDDASDVSPTGLSVQKHYQDVIFIPGRGGALDNDAIKQALMNYGGVMTSYYDQHGTAYIYRPSTHSYYFFGADATSNHAVTIVGWDDNFAKSNFATTPPGNGAFIIKNSWGANWGESGYFYISYYDSILGSDGNFVFKSPGEPANYNRIYQYDPLGITSGLGQSSPTGWFANVFTAAPGEKLAAVSFYAMALNSSYEIYIYTNVGSTPLAGTLSATTAGSIAEAGYHTVQLPSPVVLTVDQKFSIVVKLTTPGYNYPIPIEHPAPGYAAPTSSPGQSYVSIDGTSWTDVTTIDTTFANTNVCVKGFTLAYVPPTLTGLAVTGMSSVNQGSAAAYQATAIWSDNTTSAATAAWSVSPVTYAAISSSGLLTAAAVPSDQSVTVTASYTSGGVTKTATRNVIIIVDSADGDINGTGTLDLADGLKALRIAVHLDAETPAALAHGDMVKNGKIDIADALYILKKVVGLI